MKQEAKMQQLLQQHRSIRKYKSTPLDPELVDEILVQSLQGTSSSGNLNMVSVIKTSDPERKAQLCELHNGQPMVLQAPLVLSFCADSFRTRQWLQRRKARLGFADFLSWHVAAVDAVILAQTTALALQSHGLGICYMGTTLNNMRAIADFLQLPENCLPVTSLVVGWPDEEPSQRDRLPASAWIHDERYQRPSPEQIDRDFGNREQRGWQRYREAGPEMTELMQAHGIESLAQFYTSKLKYDPDRSGARSEDILKLLQERGFIAKDCKD